jgi:hypothetical protein
VFDATTVGKHIFVYMRRNALRLLRPTSSV